jgi:bzd-type benzoyl-CoA reductase N subunit
MDLEDRSKRVRELKNQGKKVMGYFCCYVPLEFLTALDFVPYRIWGNMQEPIDEANLHFITTSCNYARSCFNNALTGGYDFFDGVVGSKTCDTFERMFQVWRHVLKPSYAHVVHIPNASHPSSYGFFRSELQTFKDSLEKAAGRKIANEDIREAIRLHNEHRQLMKQLYEFRKETPPRISGSELMQTVIHAMSLPVQEGSRLLEDKMNELDQRPKPEIAKPRILIWGTPVDDISLIQLIEECGADVVMDDICIGSRHYWQDVPETEDPIDGLAERYMDKLVCPFKIRDFTTDHRHDMQNRYGYLQQYVKEFDVEGAIMQVVAYCAIHAIDVPDVKDYFNDMGLPVLNLEHDYNVATFAALRTRIQAFVETLD